MTADDISRMAAVVRSAVAARLNPGLGAACADDTRLLALALTCRPDALIAAHSASHPLRHTRGLKRPCATNRNHPRPCATTHGSHPPGTKRPAKRLTKRLARAPQAGALGFSTSRTLLHRDKWGVLVPGTLAGEEEISALGRAVAEGGGGILEMATDFMCHDDAPFTEADHATRPVACSGLGTQRVGAARAWRVLQEARPRRTTAPHDRATRPRHTAALRDRGPGPAGSSITCASGSGCSSCLARASGPRATGCAYASASACPRRRRRASRLGTDSPCVNSPWLCSRALTCTHRSHARPSAPPRARPPRTPSPSHPHSLPMALAFLLSLPPAAPGVHAAARNPHVLAVAVAPLHAVSHLQGRW